MYTKNRILVFIRKMSSIRAVHFRICNIIETDSFILALRRFTVKPGNIRVIKLQR